LLYPMRVQPQRRKESTFMPRHRTLTSDLFGELR
jgi:hypothetical protein